MLVWSKEALHVVGRNVNYYRPRETVQSFLRKLERTTIWSNYSTRVYTQSIYSKVSIQQRHLHIHVYHFTVHNSNLWDQPRCLSTDEQTLKRWYIYLMEYYSATLKNKIMLFVGKWIELEAITLSEISQMQKVSCVFTCMWKLELKK
jgi:hypothetical protein